MFNSIFSFGIIDFVIIVTFCFATLFVGIKSGLRIKNFEGYATGFNNFTSFSLVATITATYMSGSGFFYDIKHTYIDSIIYLFAACLMGINLLIMAWVIIPRMQNFMKKTTIIEKMGEIYGNHIRVVLAFVAIFASIGSIAVQFKVLGIIISYCTHVNYASAIIISSVVVTIYSSIGGIKSVTATDKVQLATFLIAIPYVILIVIDETFYKGFSSTGAPPLFNILPGTFSPSNPKFWDCIVLGLWLMIPSMKPVYCQRVLMAKNVKQAKFAFSWSAILIILITLLLGILSLIVYNYNPNIGSEQIIYYIIDNFTVIGLKGFLVVGIIAMAMSTADSFINISAILFSNDICKPLKLYKGKELIVAKLFSVLLGVCAIYLSFSKHDLLTIILSTNKYYMPIATAPILLTIFGFRTTSKSIILGMLAASTVYLFPISNILKCLTGILLNGGMVIISHYLLNQSGGWVKVRLDENSEDNRKIFDDIARVNVNWQNTTGKDALYTGLDKALENNNNNFNQFGAEQQTIMEQEAMYKAAVKLKKQGLPEHIIAKVTDLTLQQVKEL